MEKLGVIGGMGAEATSYYYDQVVRHTAATCDQEHIDMVVLSKSTMPDRTLAIKTGEHTELLATMKECAQALESLGCAHIAIPCNTSHYFYDQIQSFTKVPIIHMPRESVRYALKTADETAVGHTVCTSSSIDTSDTKFTEFTFFRTTVSTCIVKSFHNEFVSFFELFASSSSITFS